MRQHAERLFGTVVTVVNVSERHRVQITDGFHQGHYPLAVNGAVMLGKDERREVVVAAEGVEKVEIHHQLGYPFVIFHVILANVISLPGTVEPYFNAEKAVDVGYVTLKRA